MKINLGNLPEHYPPFFYMDLHERYPKSFLVAEEGGGNIVGYVMCRAEGGFSSFGITKGLAKKGHIISIAVVPEHRRKGLGSMLVSESIERLKRFYSCRECYLEVRVSNNMAIALYKKLGFKIIKRNPWYYKDGEAAFTMSRKL